MTTLTLIALLCGLIGLALGIKSRSLFAVVLGVTAVIVNMFLLMERFQ
jgi:hypothetical protein